MHILKVSFAAFLVGFFVIIRPSLADTTGVTETLRHQAQSGDAHAQVALGRALQSDGNDADKSAGTDWFRKAADQGDADGAWMLGGSYMGGVGTNRDIATAIQWMQKSVQINPVPDRMANLAFAMMVSGMVSNDQQQQAMAWAKKAAEAGSTKGMQLLAMMDLTSTGTKDPVAAEHWLLLASKKGDTDAQAMLGAFYIAGNFGHKDIAAGTHWLQTAADGGNTHAGGQLAAFYITGDYGVPVDGAKGVALARKAIAANDVAGHYAMGIAYVTGTGVNRDPAKGWYELAIAERMDTKHELTHVADHMSTAATQLSAAQLSELKAKVDRDVPSRSSTAP